MLTFEILWYSGGPDHAPNRVIGRDTVQRRDLDAAITTACNRLRAGRCENSRMARGFYVRAARP